MEGRTIIALGSMLGRSGEPEIATKFLREGLELIDMDLEPRIALVANHNLVHYLIDSGCHDEAMQLLTETRALHAELGNAVDLTRFKWLEGYIALEQGDLQSAEATFDEVKAFFVEKSMAHDTALVSLDLATVYLQQGRLTELRTLSAEMLTIFEGLGSERESRAALSFFEKAIEVEKAQMEMVGDLLEYLHSVRLEERVVARLSVSS